MGKELELIYTNSEGIKKDIRSLDFQYVVNAFAKSIRLCKESLTKEEFLLHQKNVNSLNLFINEFISKKYEGLLINSLEKDNAK